MNSKGVSVISQGRSYNVRKLKKHEYSLLGIGFYLYPDFAFFGLLSSLVRFGLFYCFFFDAFKRVLKRSQTTTFARALYQYTG